MCNENSGCGCIADVLNVINILQQNADCCGDECLDTCDKKFLGNSITPLNYNTRPIMIYTCNSGDTAITMPISKDPTETTTSNIFRVEKVEDCCATFRVLTPNTDPTTSATIPYVATNSFFTLNLNCCCRLRCLNDTFVECI